MKIAVLGTGLMGAPMAQNLHQQGHQIAVWNRSREKLDALTAQGLIASQTAADAVQHAELIVTMLTDIDAIQSVLNSIPDTLWAGKTLLQSSTITAEQSRDLQKCMEQKKAQYFECPVLGSIPQAATGSLILICAGPEPVYQSLQAILKLIGSETHYMGPDCGQAAAAKLALNQLIPSLIAMFGLSLHYIQAQGIEPENWMKILRSSALYAPSYDKKLQRLLDNDFTHPNFPVKHMLKDVQLFLDTAQTLDTRMLDALKGLLQKNIDQGLAEADYSAVGNAVLNSKTE